MGRGRHYSWWRRAAEAAEALVYGGGWAARLAYEVGLQGKLDVDRRSVPVSSGRGREEAPPETGASARRSSPPLRLDPPIQTDGIPRMPLRLAFASDLHAGPLTDPRLLARVFAEIAGFRPHLVLLGGDYVSLHHDHLDAFVPLLRSLAAPPLGVLGVFGNHDLWLEDEAIAARLTAAGVRLLVNESVRLPAPYEEVVVCGLDEPDTGDPRPDLALADAGGIRILLVHSPLGLRLVPEDGFHLALCGHTHGGQIALPGGVPIVLPRGSGDRRYARGVFGMPSGTLIVSNGVGMSDLPVRLFAPSQVHLLSLGSPAAR